MTGAPQAPSSTAPASEESPFKRDLVKNREDWLTKAIAELRDLAFIPAGYTVPENIRVSCSWPSRGGNSRVLGQCWNPRLSRDRMFEIYITPRLDDPAAVLPVLGHEIVHAVVGLKCGHRGPFRTCALAIGLEGRMTATVAGEAFKRLIDPIVAALGPYPHGALMPFRRPEGRDAPKGGDPTSPEWMTPTPATPERETPEADEPESSGPKQQKGRLRKATCLHCRLVLRITTTWLRDRELGCPDPKCSGHDEPLHIE